MPYLDGSYKVSEGGGSYFSMESAGEYAADNTDGTLVYEADEDEEDDESETEICARCGNDVDTEDVSTVVTVIGGFGDIRQEENWCEHCSSHHTWLWNDMTLSDGIPQAELDGEEIPEVVAERRGVWCDEPGGYFTCATVTVRCERGSTTWTLEEAKEHARLCPVSGVWFTEDVALAGDAEIWRGADPDEVAEWRADFGALLAARADPRQESLLLQHAA